MDILHMLIKLLIMLMVNLDSLRSFLLVNNPRAQDKSDLVTG